jgi:hypothetical protein
MEVWTTHLKPLGFLGYNEVLNSTALFYWGEMNYSDTNYNSTVWYASQSGSGIGKIQYDAVKAVDSLSDQSLVILEASPEYTIEKWEVGNIAAFKYGTGGHGDADDLFNNPKDVTVDSMDYVYVLDILSNGQPRIKIFSPKLQPVLGLGNGEMIPGTPIACDWDNYYDALHVLTSTGVIVIPKHE